MHTSDCRPRLENKHINGVTLNYVITQSITFVIIISNCINLYIISLIMQWYFYVHNDYSNCIPLYIYIHTHPHTHTHIIHETLCYYVLYILH